MRVNCLSLRGDTLLMLVEANAGSSFQVRVKVFSNGSYWFKAASHKVYVSALLLHFN